MWQGQRSECEGARLPFCLYWFYIQKLSQIVLTGHGGSGGRYRGWLVSEGCHLPTRKVYIPSVAMRPHDLDVRMTANGFD